MRTWQLIFLCVHFVVCAKKSQSVIDNFNSHRVNRYVYDFFADTFAIGNELCTLRTMKIITGFTPLLLCSFKVDNKIHRFFYDRVNHENKHQPPGWLQVFAEYSVMGIPATVGRFFALAHREHYERRAFQVFATGLLWALALEEIIKSTAHAFEIPFGLRPVHPGFSRDWKYYHGAPSGHVVFISYTATYFGLYKGPFYGVPLWLYTGLIMGLRTAGNHHYLSQVVMGAGIGLLMGITSFGAFKRVMIPEGLSVGMGVGERGGMEIKVAYEF